MRFITEFELNFPYQLSVLETYKVRHQLDISSQVGESFNWENKPSEDKEAFKLDIEAFPTDEWIIFKRKLFFELEKHNPDAIKILQMIKDLEFSGAQKTT